jgi:hypothetical protein
MNTKKITMSILSVGASFVFAAALSPLVASAATPSAGTVQANTAARLAKIITRSDSEITARESDLNNLNTRVQAMVNVSTTEKTDISNEVQSNIAGLTSLKSKIDADTDVTTALNDEKTIFGSYRIYALVVPRGYIVASADRVDTIVGMMTTISSKLQTRITADQSAGDNVTALQNSLTDLNAKIADAKSQAGTAQSGVVSLVPDQGNTTQLSSNTAALKAARADIKTSTQDLQAARADAKSIMQGLKSLE